MEFNHLSFYVDDVVPWRDWFMTAWGGRWAGEPQSDHSALVYVGQVPLLIVADPAVVGAYLTQHPPGIGDAALRVLDLAQTLDGAGVAGDRYRAGACCATP